MSNYKSNLQINNESLASNNLDFQSLIDQANALPDAGGGAVETCTVTFPNFSLEPTLCYTSPTEGFIDKKFTYRDDLTISVIKDTIIYANLSVFNEDTYIYEG
jgi:hypothetical protein